MIRLSRLRLTVLALSVLLGALSLLQLEGARRGLAIERGFVGPAPATIYRPAEPQGLVVVAHGFGGSRQMMQALSLTLARAGQTVVAFDFPGHGRNPEPLSPVVTEISGTTAQLVARTGAVIDAAVARFGGGPVTLVGHSMATDVIIRAAAPREIETVVAVSMYSEAVTPTHPARLLVISGAWEERLRRAGLQALAQVDPTLGEGETAAVGDVLRRTIAAPRVEHVGVLYHPSTLDETLAWAVPDAVARPVILGPAILALLASIVAAYWAAAPLLPAAGGAPAPLAWRRIGIAVLIPALPAFAAAHWIGGPLLGAASYGRLTVFFAVWGGLQLWLLRRWGVSAGPVVPGAVISLLVWGLGVFAPALDRYGSAFAAVGPRLPLAVVLAAGTLPFMLAEARLTAGAGFFRTALVKTVPILVLAGAMIATPLDFGLLFTVLPVMILFHLVYGAMARWTAARAGAESAGWALGLSLAVALAASQPIFDATG
ncbi:MAG: alpha/beta fold hydrolase [Pseudomonadota bacterium]